MHALEQRNVVNSILSKLTAEQVRDSASVSRVFRNAAHNDIGRRVLEYKHRFRDISRMDAEYAAAMGTLSWLEESGWDVVSRLVAPFEQGIPGYVEMRTKLQTPFYLDVFSAYYIMSPDPFESVRVAVLEANMRFKERDIVFWRDVRRLSGALLLHLGVWVTDASVAHLLSLIRLFRQPTPFGVDYSFVNLVYRIMQRGMLANGVVQESTLFETQILSRFVDRFGLQGTSRTYQYLFSYALHDTGAFERNVEPIQNLLDARYTELETDMKAISRDVLSIMGFHDRIEDENIEESSMAFSALLPNLHRILSSSVSLRSNGYTERKRVRDLVAAMAFADKKTLDYLDTYHKFSSNARRNGMMPDIVTSPINELKIPRLMRRGTQAVAQK